MGLAEGGITYRTYYVEGELPSNLKADFLERIHARRFRPLTLEAEEDISLGWVPIDNPLATSFSSPELFVAEYLVLALRFDRWAVPPVLLKATVRQAERSVLKEQKRVHLTRTERGAIAEREKARLKRESLPAVRLIDMAWNLDTGELRLTSLSRHVNELFAHHFELTFQMRLVPESPYIRALHGGLGDEQVARLADIEPARLLGD